MTTLMGQPSDRLNWFLPINGKFKKIA